MNSVARVRLSSGSITGVDSSTLRVIDLSNFTNVAGTISVSGSLIEFTPEAACPAPWQDRKCFAANTSYKISVSDGAGVIQCSSNDLVCNLSGDCEATFTTGDFVDTEPPSIYLIDRQICQAPDNELQAWVDDDYGIAYVEFRDLASPLLPLGIDSDVSVPPAEVASASWDP